MKGWCRVRQISGEGVSEKGRGRRIQEVGKKRMRRIRPCTEAVGNPENDKAAAA